MPGPTDNPTLTTRTITPGQLVRRLAQFAWRHKLAAVPALISTLAMQFLILASLQAQGLALDTLRAVFDASDSTHSPAWPWGLTPPDQWTTMHKIGVLVVAMLVLGLLAGGARYATRVFEEFFVQACIVDLRTRLYERLQRLGFRFFDAHDSGQVINRITADAQSVRSFIQGVMVRGVIAVVTFTVFLVFMLREHAMLALACLAVMPIQTWVMVRFANRNKPRFMEQMRLVDVLVRCLQESIAGVRVIRAFGRERHQTEVFDGDAARARDHRLRIAKDRAIHIPVVQSGNFLTLAILIGFGGYLVMIGETEGGIALGTLWVFKGLVERIAGQAEALVWLVGGAPEALAGAERVFALLDHELDIDGAEDSPGAKHLRSEQVEGRVAFEHVSFAYNAGDPVLEDVSFVVEPGTTVAVVGPTGSGKSTLAALVARFYDPSQGSITIDGYDLRTIDPRIIRSNIAFVFQDPFLFSNTIGTNIAFGDPTAAEAEIISASRDAQADEFIREMEDGYETVVGERGVSLSGGQRQRLTLARSLLVRTPLLVLDDPTGAVDPITETAIQRALDARRKGRTTLIIAHRLSTLRRADHIIVLDKGRIVDSGTHDELFAREGHYRVNALIQLALEEEESQRREGAA